MSPWSAIADLLDGKTVAIIGGAVDLLSDDQLCRYDLHVWTNNHWLKRRGKIDGLFHCCGPRVPAKEILSQGANPTFFVGCGWAVEAPRFAAYFNDLKTPALFYDDSTAPLYAPLQRRAAALGASTPLTGLIAANFMSMMPAKAIGLLAMNLYTGADHNLCVAAHNPMAHAHLFKRLLDEDGRFAPCPELASSIDALLTAADSAPRESFAVGSKSA